MPRRKPSPEGDWRDAIKRRHARRASLTECERCSAPAWSGLDEDVGAFDALADPTPIDAACELSLLLQGVATYTFDGSQLTRRRDGLLVRRPGRIERLVLAAHRCGITIQPSRALSGGMGQEAVIDDSPPF